MTMWVWEDVLEDYTQGIVVVYAESAEHAWRLLIDADDIAAKSIVRECGGQITESDLLACALACSKQPVEITSPRAFVVWGGG